MIFKAFTDFSNLTSENFLPHSANNFQTFTDLNSYVYELQEWETVGTIGINCSVKQVKYVLYKSSLSHSTILEKILEHHYSEIIMSTQDIVAAYSQMNPYQEINLGLQTLAAEKDGKYFQSLQHNSLSCIFSQSQKWVF